jgi:hypothetical protein
MPKHFHKSSCLNRLSRSVGVGFSRNFHRENRSLIAGIVVIGIVLVIGEAPANSNETTYTCFNNAGGTSTCVSNVSSQELNCTVSGGGVRTCVDKFSNQRLNCLVNSDSTVSCRDADTNEKLDCVGLGFGENACRNGSHKGKPTEVITDPSLFDLPPTNPNKNVIPSYPEVIELPSAFQ